MDKLAPAIAWIKENGFWLANGLLLLLMIGLWYVVTGTLNEEKGKNVTKIKQQVNLADGILRKKPLDLTDPEIAPMHPNKSTEEGMQEELKRTVDSIIAAWHLRVDAQKKLLVFPAVIENERFAEVFAPYNPPETFPVELADVKTIEPLLNLYARRIPIHMINICGKDGVRTNWRWDPENYDQEGQDSFSKRLEESNDGGGEKQQPLQVANEDASRFAVLWSDINQKLWHDKLTKFQGRNDNNGSVGPTPLQAYMLQQDLWVLEAMFNVIRDLNGDSNSTDTSAIKEIAHIGIGINGTVKLGTLHPVDRRFAPQVAAVTGQTEPGASSSGFESGAGSDSSGNALVFSEEVAVVDGAASVDSEAASLETDKKLPPFHNMYVDTKLEPISSEEVLKVVKGTELSETNLELLIAKRLPVRIALKMDERKIPNFMAACINSPFSFEIQQVRINRHNPNGEFIPLGGQEKTAVQNGAGDNVPSNFDKVSRTETRANYDVNVEFFGIIKIYNPVRADIIRAAAGLPTEQPQPGTNPDSAAIRRSPSTLRTAG